MNQPINQDRYDMEETELTADEREWSKHNRRELAIERADMLRDELRDRQAEEVDAARNGKEQA